jgi:hypothetical protein
VKLAITEFLVGIGHEVYTLKSIVLHVTSFHIFAPFCVF